MGASGFPVQLHVGFHQQFVRSRIVDRSLGFSLAVLKHERRRAIGLGPAGHLVHGDAGGFDGHQRVLRLAGGGHPERNLDVAIRIEVAIGIGQRGRRARHQVVGASILVVQLQLDVFHLDPRGVLRLGEVRRLEIVHLAASVGAGKLKAVAIGTQLGRQRPRPGGRVLAQGLLSGHVGDAYAAENRDNRHQQEPPRASHG